MKLGMKPGIKIGFRIVLLAAVMIVVLPMYPMKVSAAGAKGSVVGNLFKGITKWGEGWMKSTTSSTATKVTLDTANSRGGKTVVKGAGDSIQGAWESLNPYNTIKDNLLQQGNTGYKSPFMDAVTRGTGVYNSPYNPLGNEKTAAAEVIMRDESVVNSVNNNNLIKITLNPADKFTEWAQESEYENSKWEYNMRNPSPNSPYAKGGVESIKQYGKDMATGTIENAQRAKDKVVEGYKEVDELWKEESKVNTDANSKDYMLTDKAADIKNGGFLKGFCDGLYVISNGRINILGDSPNSSAANGKKPNIYLYGEIGQKVTVAFADRERLTAADPDYPSDGWQVALDGTGRLLLSAQDQEAMYLAGVYGLGGDRQSEDGTIGYLFYESVADLDRMQYDTAWLIGAEDRYETLYALMTAYGFNETESKDFADFWDGYLKEDRDYLFYPQLTATVDEQMPLLVTPVPEHSFRLWFAIRETDANEKQPQVPEITERATHEGYAMTEWGIVFIREDEFTSCSMEKE